MEMHQVRYFLAVCDTLNFTRAAGQCHVAQPSLTRAIHKLEEELGGPLFRRERSRTHLTDLGRLMHPHIQAVQDATLAAQAEASDFHSLEKAPLRLGVMCTIGPVRLVDFFTQLQRQIPSLELQLQDARGSLLVEQLLDGSLDVALAGLPAYPERIDARRLFQERYLIAFPRGHRFAQMNAVPLSELDGEAYLQRTNCEFSDHFEALGREQPLQVKLRYRSEREDWIQAMVLAGMGCCIMPEFLPALPGIASRPVVDPQVSRVISLVTVAGRPHSAALSAMTRLARRHPWPGS